MPPHIDALGDLVLEDGELALALRPVLYDTSARGGPGGQVLPSPVLPQGDALRPAAPATLAEAQDLVARFVDHYNRVRLHSALGYIAPWAFMAGQAPTIWAERDRKLEAAREHRRQRRQTERVA